MKKLTGVLLALALVMGSASPLFADSSSDMMSMLQSMKDQMAKMQQTIDAQNSRIQQLEGGRTAQPAAATPGESEYQPKLSEADWQKNIGDNIGTAVPWLKGAKFAGDFRLRYEAFDYYDKNNDAGSTGTAADRTRNRFRVRLRWGFEKDYGDDWKVGFRLATSPNASTNGQPTDQTSTNQTLGNAGYFNFKSINVERAYAQYSPNSMKDYGMIKGVTVGAGKFENPFLRYSTTMTWDPDVTPEGAYEKVNLQFVSTEDNKLNLYTTFGQFIINENSGYSQDAEMYGYQGALNWSTYNLGTELPVDFTTAVSYYDYPGWSQTITAANNTAGVSYQRTNTLNADNFRVLNIYPEIQFYINRMPIVLWYDYAKNLADEGLNDPATLGRTIFTKDDAWGVGFKVNKAKKKGDWEAFYGYWQIGADSVVAAFNDSDFGGPGTAGYTNRKGHKFGFTYKLTDNVDVSWTGYLVAPLDSTLLVANSTNESVFRSQADLVYKF